MAPYSVPEEAARLLRTGILQNPLLNHLPPDAVHHAARIRFVGSPTPSVPINWRVAEGVAALMGLQAALLNALLMRKYGHQPVAIEVNTDHATLFVLALQVMDVVDDEGHPTGGSTRAQRVNNFFPSLDFHSAQGTAHRAAATSLYRTRDGRFYHLHGGMNPDVLLAALGLPRDRETASSEDAYAPFAQKIATFDSRRLDSMVNDELRQAGTICFTPEEYAASEHGRANAHVGLYEIEHIPNPNQGPCWWPFTPGTSVKRPLAGLKVIEMTRIISGPSIGRGLAELGASVMRITAGHVPDLSSLHIEMNWGKWNTRLDLRTLKGREQLKVLILEADVVIDGYRPGAMDDYGFGKDDILALCQNCERGIIYVRENCYGWHGPWRNRRGWQQISDACCGLSTSFGRAMGHDEPVTPYLPTTDYCTGLAGVSAILQALLARGENGGTYVVQLAFNYVSRWFADSVGTYPDQVWQQLWAKHGRPVLRHDQTPASVMPQTMQMLATNVGDVLFRPEFFEVRNSPAARQSFRRVKPVLHFPRGEVALGFNVGSRTNGVDTPRWPKDLTVEMVD